MHFLNFDFKYCFMIWFHFKIWVKNNNSCSRKNIFYDYPKNSSNNGNGYRLCATWSFTIFLWEACLQCRWEQKVCYWLMSFITYSSAARMWFSIGIITYKPILRSWSSSIFFSSRNKFLSPLLSSNYVWIIMFLCSKQ